MKYEGLALSVVTEGKGERARGAERRLWFGGKKLKACSCDVFYFLGEESVYAENEDGSLRRRGSLRIICLKRVENVRGS